MFNGVKVAHILATTEDFLIGIDDKLPWNCPEDLKYFKNLTYGGIVCMGRNTYNSIGCKPLPNRYNFVITTKNDIEHENISTSSNIQDCLYRATEFAKVLGLDKIFVIGGVSIYQQTEMYVDKIYWNIIHTPLTFNSSDVDCMYYYQPNIDGMTLHAKDSVYNKDSDLTVTTMLYEHI